MLINFCVIVIYLHAVDKSQRIKQQQCIIIEITGGTVIRSIVSFNSITNGQAGYC